MNIRYSSSVGADQCPVAVQGLTFLSLGSHCPMQNIRIVCSILTTLTGRGSSNPLFLPRFGGCILQLEEYQILNRPAVFEVVKVGKCSYSLWRSCHGEFHSCINYNCNLPFYLRLPMRYALAGCSI